MKKCSDTVKISSRNLLRFFLMGYNYCNQSECDRKRVWGSKKNSTLPKIDTSGYLESTSSEKLLRDILMEKRRIAPFQKSKVRFFNIPGLNSG